MNAAPTVISPFQPRLIRAWNALSTKRVPQESFSAAALMQAASKKCRLFDFGDLSFTAGYEAFISALNQSPPERSFGRFYVREMLVAMLVHRLKMVEYLKQHPEVGEEKIERPLVILGLPRSGTTFLFNLLSQDPSNRFMPNWEAFVAQVPPNGSYSFETDPRRKVAKRILRFQKYLMPQLDTQHVFAAEHPEECTAILMQSFATQAMVGMFDVPEYGQWLEHADQLPTYMHHKRSLQVLQSKYGADRWLLKSPDHMPAIEALSQVYPDARIIHIHRDPVRSISSWASLALTLRGAYYDQVDTHELGEQVLGRLGDDMDRYMRHRPAHSQEYFQDLDYQKLVADPIATVRRIYEGFGYGLSHEAQTRMEAYLENNRQHKHGAHKYEPEDFGLTATQIRERFSSYLGAFEDHLSSIPRTR